MVVKPEDLQAVVDVLDGRWLLLGLNPYHPLTR